MQRAKKPERMCAIRLERLLRVSILICCASTMIGSAGAETRPYMGALTVTVENDVFTGSDNGYTNGIGISWATNATTAYDPDSFVPRWANFWSFLPFVADEGYETYASWTLGQEMHSPDDITIPNPPEDEQPYAGILYLDSILQARKGRCWHNWSSRIGVVGDASGAEDVQKWVHEITGSDEPEGWDTQLPNEPFVNIGYILGYRWHEGELGDWVSWRVVPIVNADLGTYVTAIGAGMYGEVGRNLPAAMPTNALRSGFSSAATMGAGPQEAWSLSLYAALGGFAVAHYLPLDGTVFRDSRSADRDWFSGTLSGGVSVRYQRFVINLGTSYFSGESHNQREGLDFGTLSLSWYF